MDANRHSGHGSKHNIRLSRVATDALTAWIEANQAHPYPNDSDKASLQAETRLSHRQINNWFANARRRRHRRVAPETQQAVQGVMYAKCDNPPSLQSAGLASTKTYQCTFCTESWATKYDWIRHELSVHLPLKRYICSPFAPITTDTATNEDRCAYCGQTDPTTEHIALHNHASCQDRPPEARIFYRKDHLKQHLQSVHRCDLLPRMEKEWMLEAVYVNSRCGFCGMRFSLWNERNEHIASHYRQGTRMDEWRGCRGLDSEIAALVTHAMPPFLIGQRDIFPFYTSLMEHKPNRLGVGYQDGETIWESLVDSLQRLVRRSSSQHLMLSDQTLQSHARQATYGTTESRAKTPADNPEWLDLFKRSYSLSLLPNLTEEHSPNINVAEDLEVYQDLGIRLPPNQQSARRSSALMTLFRSDGPSAKSYHRFSSVEIPVHLALAFETIAMPWPDAGILGDTVDLKEMLFLRTLDIAVGRPAIQLEDSHDSIGGEEH
ncbi:hypothetical protein Q7P36_004636 [Cladosporium allicinum]